ncbi:MAG: hypothetical protein QOE33_2152 [Acidobacteriota bacterium]|nr:hypothetical protein [Acidobacteriota bacterium]
MKRTVLIGSLLLAAASFAIAATNARGAGTSLNRPTTSAVAIADDNFDERDSSRQTYALSPGASVDINSVSGHVTIETAATDQAEVEIIRTARTRGDLECRKFKIEASANRLRLDGNENRERCHNVQVNQTLNLRLPRRVNLDVKSVSGDVRVGELEGTAHLSSISGSAIIARVAGEATLTSVSGRVSVNLSRLGGGVRVNSVSGNVEVGLPEGANADISVRSISGNVTTDISGMSLQKTDGSNYDGRVGSGGTPLTFNSISGNVRFHRTGE